MNQNNAILTDFQFQAGQAVWFSKSKRHSYMERTRVLIGEKREPREPLLGQNKPPWSRKKYVTCMQDDSFTPTDAPGHPPSPRSSYPARRLRRLDVTTERIGVVVRLPIAKTSNKTIQGNSARPCSGHTPPPIRNLQESTADPRQPEVSFGYYLAASLPVLSDLVHSTVLRTSLRRSA